MRLRVGCALASCAASLLCAGPAVAAHRAEPVPILEYHVIGVPAPGAPFGGLYVSPAVFRAQVGWLAAHGWHAVTLDRVLRHWLRDAPLPRRPVVLTFDDGYPGDLRYALPDLQARGWPGVLNLQIGDLVPARVRELLAAGWEVDAHTFTHPDLTAVSPARLRHEVAGSRRWIRDVLHVPVDAFAYPDGRYDAAVVAAVRRAGFLAAETERPGWASPRQGLLTLDRLEVTASMGVPGLAAMLR